MTQEELNKIAFPNHYCGTVSIKVTPKEQIEQDSILNSNIDEDFTAGVEWAYKDVLQTIDKLLLYLDCDAYTTDARIGMRVFTNELKKRLTV